MFILDRIDRELYSLKSSELSSELEFRGFFTKYLLESFLLGVIFPVFRFSKGSFNGSLKP